ncbi:MAG: 50S ribosomal protein L13 [Candidatus Margulisbacteria bacterium]|nr:50S ribosomal protein L13 [Candidatus Margulisiibacteriota bacterium]
MKKIRTIFTREQDVKRTWYKIDATGQVLGRLASKAAVYLRGKHKPTYTPQTDCGDFIVVVNADKVKVTGRKLKGKTYFTHSGYPGGDKTLTFERMIEIKPEKVIQLAVRGMLPHNRLGDKMIKKLKIFKTDPAQFSKIQKLEVQ